MGDQNKQNAPTGTSGRDEKIGGENWQQGQTDTNRQGNSPGDKQTETRNRENEGSNTEDRPANR